MIVVVILNLLEKIVRYLACKDFVLGFFSVVDLRPFSDMYFIQVATLSYPHVRTEHAILDYSASFHDGMVHQHAIVQFHIVTDFAIIPNKFTHY